ncbi:MAG: hypothetical protein ACKO4L_08875, partial [Nodosilinea sp.]
KDAFSDLHFMDQLMPAKAAGMWDDRQGFLGQESGLGPEPRKQGTGDGESEIGEFAQPKDTLEAPATVDTTRS